LKHKKYFYIGSERVASALGTVRDLGMLCEQSGFPDATIIERMNNKVDEAAVNLRMNYDAFGKTLVLQEPFHYGTGMQLICDGNHDPELYAPYWYHPDHLGSSSYITNLEGEINQHMEYLPFGETLVEEHLNSNNSPFKFNAKELDPETGNYYYGARYYNPKWSVFLSVDQHYFNYPSFSPYAYTAHNPINLIDPDGRDWRDKDGNLVYDVDKGDYTEFATDQDKKFGENLRNSGKIGEKQFKYLTESKHQTKVIFDEEGTDPDMGPYAMGRTDVVLNDNQDEIIEATITIYMKANKEAFENPDDWFYSDELRLIKQNSLGLDDIVTSTLGHEISHTTLSNKLNSLRENDELKQPLPKHQTFNPEKAAQAVGRLILKELAKKK
jgi:RHS repeat-associated protein